MEIIALLFVLFIHNVGEVPESPAQTCAPQQVVVMQIGDKIVLRGEGERVCFASIK